MNPIRTKIYQTPADAPESLICDVDDEIAFECQTGNPTDFFVGTTSFTGGSKGGRLDYASSLLSLSKIEFITKKSPEGYFFKIWEVE
jgi:hypothetical protein